MSIAGTTKPLRLEENLGVATVELMAGDLGKIGAVLASVTVQGDRYPPHPARTVGR